MSIAAIQVSVPSVSPAANFRFFGDTASSYLRSFAFGPFILIPGRQLLVKNGSPVRIGGRALDILVALVEKPGELIAKKDLMLRAWPNTFVDETNLKVNMTSLRRVLGECHATPEYIATVVGRGYRFVAPVQTSAVCPGATIDRDTLTVTRIASLLEAVEAIRRELQEIGQASQDADAHAGATSNH